MISAGVKVSECSRALRAILSCVLTLLLFASGVPASAFAISSDSAMLFAGQAQSMIDLNEAWASSTSGLDGSYTITEGGSYYLSDDLQANGNLVIDAEGQDVTIFFEGHTLTVNGSGAARQKTMLAINAARSVFLDGTSSEGTSALVSAGQLDVRALSSTAADCAVKAKDLAVVLSSASNAQRNLSTHCVRISSGTLELDACTLTMDMGNQSLCSSDLVADTTPEVPSAVYATADVDAVSLNGCTVVACGPSGFSLEDLADTTTIGNAYGVYSLAAKTVIKGGTYQAVSLRGNATCLYGTSLEVEADDGAAVALEADAGQMATGILSTQAGGVALNAPLEFSIGADYAGEACAEAALRSTVQGGFVFGACAPEGSETYPVLVMTDGSLENANADGSYLGTFAPALDSEQASGVLGALVDALGDAGSCSVTSDLNGIKFTLDVPRAVATVVDVQGVATYWSTLTSALDKLAAAPGSTLTLNKDVSSMVVSDAVDATINLGGHTVTSFVFSSEDQGNGLVVKNGTIGGAATAVSHCSPTPLSFEHVSIKASSTDANAYGIYAAASTGRLSLSDDSSIDVIVSQSSRTGTVGYGIGMASDGPELSVDSTSIAVATSSAGVAVYGLYSSNVGALAKSAITASGTTGTVCAVSVGGSFSIEDSRVEARASGASSTTCGIWARTSTPKATDVTVDSCAITAVTNSSASDALAACLLGATTETGTSSAAWTLSGPTSFTSSAGIHIGLNVGAITLASDFSLTDGSESPLVVSQAACEANVGFTCAEGATQDQARKWAAQFVAKAGSYYEGWELAADEGRLIWRAQGDSDGAGIVEVVHEGTSTRWGSMAQALAQAESGDAVVLQADLVESGTCDIAQDDLTVNLNGHTLAMRAGNKASAGTANAGGVLRYTGSGSLVIEGGRLSLSAGAATEPSSGATYQGVSVSGGGELVLARDAALDVAYAGSTSSTAAQRSVVLRGIALVKGAVSLEGALTVTGAASDGALGAMSAYGVFVQSAENAEASVNVASSATVETYCATAAKTVKNTFYAETGANTSSQSGPTGLREIKIDPELDAEFYHDVVDQFRASAALDDSSDKGMYAAGIYYVMGLALERDGAWYDGLKIWAFSDVPADENIGKLSSIVPTHVFVSTAYDTLPNAYGIATGESSKGSDTVMVGGSVTVACAHGNAHALEAADATDADASWTCAGAKLTAHADDAVHLVAQGAIDLRDYIDFAGAQTARVAYSGFSNAQDVAYGFASARAAAVGEGVAFTLDGSETFMVEGGDAAAVEADSITVGRSFTLSEASQRCSMAQESGVHEAGAVFAMPTSGAAIDVTLFEDAYDELATAPDAGGNAVWSAGATTLVVFKVGDAIVARYADADSIELSEASEAAAKAADQRQAYTLVGWSLNPDEHATSGYLDVDATMPVTESAVYYAVYDTGMTTVPVRFTNVFDAEGQCCDDVVMTAVYGQTVGQALAEAGLTLPEPADYVDDLTGATYRFAGWYPYSNSIPVSPLVYDQDQVNDLEVTLSANGVNTGALTLRATYRAVGSGQHLVSFMVDGTTSVCVVDDGEHPAYTDANSTNESYVVPAKEEEEVGKTFTFSSWLDACLGESYDTILPRAIADASYEAQWSWEWSDVELTFHYLLYDEENDALVSDAVKAITTTYEQPTQSVADLLVAIGSSIGYGGKVYTLEGWAVRKTDVEALYDENNPLPSVVGDDRALSSDYAKTFYAIYSTADHRVDVSFFDGKTCVGTANVVATDSSVNDAFAATGSKTPADRSSTQVFLGWAVKSDASKALNGTSTTIESLVGHTDTSLSLYAIYGAQPSYTVNMRTAKGLAVLYKLTVKSGQTINETAARAGVTITAPSQLGAYFAGWVTASGEHFSLDAEVSGAANLYASYKDVSVSSEDESDISATATVTYETVASWGSFDDVSDVVFTIVPRASADSPLRSTTAEYGYTIMKAYDVRLVITSAAGEETVQTGSFGSAQMKVYVGAQYENAKVRVFWLGDDDGAEKVMNSSIKEVDDEGYITVSIGNYTVGDVDEGGNLAVAYIEGGSGENTLDTDDSSDSNGKSGKGSRSSGKSTALTVKSSSSGKSASIKSSKTGASATSASGAKPSSNAASKGSSEGDGAADGDALEESASGSADDWDSNAVVLLLIIAAIIALVVRGLWKFFVVKPRREEAEAELPSMTDQYREGLTF